MPNPTEGLPHREEITIRGVDGATKADAFSAFAADLLRRVEAGEITELAIQAGDINGNSLKYYY
ncbi:MAG: hypothetical protein ACYSUC_11435 [Planctomycetota bacterium]|jgi:hypothetical protein